MCMDISIDICINMYMDMCTDMCIDMCIDMSMDMCIDMCIDMCMDMCMDMCIEMCMDMCIDMCIDMSRCPQTKKLLSVLAWPGHFLVTKHRELPFDVVTNYNLILVTELGTVIIIKSGRNYTSRSCLVEKPFLS